MDEKTCETCNNWSGTGCLLDGMHSNPFDLTCWERPIRDLESLLSSTQSELATVREELATKCTLLASVADDAVRWNYELQQITGYRDLTQDEIDAMNAVKAKGVELGALVEKVRAIPGVDQRWASIGATDLQTGLMALTRSIARPTTF